MNIKRLVLACLLIAFCGTTQAATFLIVNGTGYIAGNTSHTLAEGQAGFHASTVVTFDSPFYTERFQSFSYVSSPHENWSITVGSPDGEVLAPASHIDVGNINPAGQKAGVSVAGNGRSGNTMPGSHIEILEWQVSPAGDLVSAAVNGHVREENSLGFTNFYLRFNSAVPVPEPSAILLAVASLLPMLSRRR